jgi:hypothetical protein
MTNVRSEDWSVKPSFVPNGPTSPVVLLADDTGLTQLAGIPAVAWQTPWSELTNLELVRFSSQMALFGTVAGVRYCWRQRDLKDYEVIRAMVVEHGGVVSRKRKRAGVLAIVGVVILASLAGGIASWFNRGGGAAQELADAKAINLTKKDLPSSWYPTTGAVLNYLVGPAGTIYTPTTTTTAAKKATSFSVAASIFQTCLGVPNKNDRVYGLAGQQPDYQVSSPVYNTNNLGGIEVASTSQYYSTTTMVQKDTKEMSKKNFATCFAQSSEAIILTGFGEATPKPGVATIWKPTTFAKGFTRAGVVPITVPGVSANLDLVMVMVTSGHYEITLSALVGSFAQSKNTLSSLVNTLLSRTETTSSRPA